MTEDDAPNEAGWRTAERWLSRMWMAFAILMAVLLLGGLIAKLAG